MNNLYCPFCKSILITNTFTSCDYTCKACPIKYKQVNTRILFATLGVSIIKFEFLIKNILVHAFPNKRIDVFKVQTYTIPKFNINVSDGYGLRLVSSTQYPEFDIFPSPQFITSLPFFNINFSMHDFIDSYYLKFTNLLNLS